MQEEQTINLIKIIKYLISKKKLIFLCCIISSLFFLLISFIIPVKYTSSCTFFPYSFETFDSKIIISENKTIKSYAEFDELEKIERLILSKRILNIVIHKANLSNYYNIEENNKKFRELLTNEELISNIEIKINKDASISISVKDRDKNQSATIANMLVSVFDSVNKDIIEVKNKPVIQAYQKKINDIKIEIITAEEGKNSINKINSLYNNLADNEKIISKVEFLKTKNYDTIDIIEVAEPPFYKSEPIRLKIILIGVFFSIISLILYLLFQNIYSQYIK